MINQTAPFRYPSVRDCRFKFYLILCCISFQLISNAIDIETSDIAIPSSIGEITNIKNTGKYPLIVLIGETHVNLDVQTKVSKLLSYLNNAYGLDLVCTEGTDNFPNLGIWHKLPSERTKYLIADELLSQRKINGVEHFALSHQNCKIVGVSDMRALREHSVILENNEKGMEEWAREFADFMQDDLMTIRATEAEVNRLGKVMESFDGDFEKLFSVLEDVTTSSPSVKKKLNKLIDNYNSITRLSKIIDGTIPSTEDPHFLARDKALVGNSLTAAKDEKLLGLVVGKAHVYGIETLLNQRAISFVTVIPTGLDDTMQSKAPVGVDKDAWLNQQKIEGDVYDNWKKGVEWGEVERFVRESDKLKPEPSLGRSETQSAKIIMHMVGAVEEMIRMGKSEQEIRKSLGSYTDIGVKILKWHPINNGCEVLFEKNNDHYWAVITSPGSLPNQYQIHASIDMLERKFTICSGRRPRTMEPPFRPISVSPPRTNVIFNKHPNVMIFEEKDGEMWRFIQDKTRPLGISFRELKDMVEKFEKANTGADKTFAAQNLCNRVLIDVNEDLEPNIENVVIISQNDILGKHSIISLVSHAGGHNYARFLNLGGSSMIPWKFRNDSDIAGVFERKKDVLKKGKIAIWFDERLTSDKEFDKLQIEYDRLGIKVNRPLENGDDLIIFGSEDSKRQFTLSDGTRIDLNNNEFYLAKANSIGSFGVELSDDFHLKSGILMRMESIPHDKFSESAKEVGKALKEGEGHLNLEESLRKLSKENLSTVKNLSNLIQLDKFSEKLTTATNLTRTIMKSQNNF